MQCDDKKFYLVFVFKILSCSLVITESLEGIGFSPATKEYSLQQVTGVWLNSFYYTHPEQLPNQYWQQITFSPNGIVNHSYFSENPQTLDIVPYTQMISKWQLGTFSHPQTSPEPLPVIRFQPIRQINYDSKGRQFQYIKGNFGPQFRRFSFTKFRNKLILSELVMLEIPGSKPISFPETVVNMTFQRISMVETTQVLKSAWGQIKNIWDY